MPKHEEIMRGLVELGISPTGPSPDLAAALASPDGTGTAPISFDEPSGRDSPNNAYGKDKAYPRAIITDAPGDYSQHIAIFKTRSFLWTVTTAK